MQFINEGLRNKGGIADVLPRYDNDSWGRYLFDLSFFFLVIVIGLSIIFGTSYILLYSDSLRTGIIIDTFSELRDEKRRNDAEVKTTCFICGLQKHHFDSKGNGWSTHIFKEHNAFAYMYYIFYLQEKKMSDCDGLEKFVKEKINNKSVEFFPLNKAMVIPESVFREPSDSASFLTQ